jgi:hypothetical protein
MFTDTHMASTTSASMGGRRLAGDPSLRDIILVDQLPSVTLLLRVRGNSPTELDALERRREFDRRVTDLVAKAIGEGDLRDDLDPALVTRLIFGTVNSLIEWYRPEHGATAREVGDALVELTVHGLDRR